MEVPQLEVTYVEFQIQYPDVTDTSWKWYLLWVNNGTLRLTSIILASFFFVFQKLKVKVLFYLKN